MGESGGVLLDFPYYEVNLVYLVEVCEDARWVF
jgi:hypothetical protein